MMESREREKYLVDKGEVNTIVTEALSVEKQEREGPADVYIRSRRVVDILAAEVVRLDSWAMWVLSPEDIELRAHNMGLTLTSEQVGEVRRLFRKAFECNNCTEILVDAIEEALDNKTG